MEDVFLEINKAIDEFVISVLKNPETKNNPEMVTAIARLLGAKF